MILTYKIKHDMDFSHELGLAKKVAMFSLEHKSITSKDVKHIGLKSMISNQILRKYSRSKTIKNVKSVKLAVPNQGIKVNGNNIHIPCLKLVLNIHFDTGFDKINQIEVDKTFAYVSCSYAEPEQYKYETILGIDRNTTGHIAVASNINTGKVLKLGKSCNHIHNKYKHIRKNLQKKGKYGLVKKIKHRESNIVRDINHNISKKLVLDACANKSIIVLEKLKEIRKTTRTRRKQRYSLNSWSFYQLEQMIEYKAKKYGVPLVYVAPQYTSQRCSRCGHIERSNRKTKSLFRCKSCGIVENADVNAGFNIAYLHQQGISRFSKESDLLKGNTDIPKKALS